MKKTFLMAYMLSLSLCMNAEVRLDKLWEYSQGTSTLPAWIGANTERSMAAYDGKLYVASRNGGSKLLVIDENGLLSKTVPMTGLASGTLKGNNIGVTADGQVLVGSAGQQGFSIQKVDSETGEATALLTSPSSNVLNGGRVDGWGVWGSMQKGYIAVPVSYIAGTTDGGNEIMIFDIENGAVTNATSPVRVSNVNGMGATATMVSDSRFYVLSGAFVPKLITYDADSQAWAVDADQFATVRPAVQCAGGAEFTYQGKTYFVSAGGSQQGALQIFDISAGLANAVEAYTTQPLGSAENTFSRTNPVCVDVRADGAYIYVLSTNNGVAAYRLYDTSVFAGTYTVGDGGVYANLYDAMKDIKARKDEIKGDITLEVVSDITETENVSIALDISPYSVTIRPDGEELRTITFTSSAVNAGPYGALVIGAETTSTAGVTTRNITIDGSGKSGKGRYLKLQTSATVYSRSHPVTIYGDVSNLAIRNCIIENRAAVQGVNNNYVICLRRIANSDIWPSDITIDNNEIINVAGTSSDGIAPDLGNSGGAGVMTGLRITNNDITARARGIIAGFVDGMEISGNTISVNQSSNGLVSSAILGFGTIRGTVKVSGNKFTDMRTANAATTGGIKTIVTEGANAIWQIENNFFGGMDKTAATGGSVFTFIECNTPSIIRHNTFVLNKTSNLPSQYTAIAVKAQANAVKEITRNIFASYETSVANAFITGADSGTSDYNSFWFEEDNTSCSFDGTNKTFEAYRTASSRDANSQFGRIDFVNPACELHISKASIGNPVLMVPRTDDIIFDIDGDERSTTTYAGADEPLVPIISTPIALRATSVTEDAFVANWSEIAGITTYKLNVYTKEPVVYVIENQIVEGMSYSVSGLTPATNYYYKVVAVDSPFESQASNEILVRTRTHQNPDEGYTLPGFVTSPYFEEQVVAYNYDPNIKVEINAPSSAEFDPALPTAIVLYGLPNGNSTDWTIGKLEAPGDDWHYQIQHIGAQTRYIRQQKPGYNLVTVYLEAASQSWGSWRSSTTNGDKIIVELTESILDIFKDFHPYIVLSGHSGGGNLVFGYMDGVSEIPSYVKRISYLDSNYNWDNARYGAKLKQWLEASADNYLSVICYDDVNALLDGKPIVSETGGTWYRSQVMQRYLEDNMSLTWTKVDNDEWKKFSADNNRIQFLMKTNPERKIFHTVLVEKNGYIQAMFAGTEFDEKGYTFFDKAVYTPYIQSATVYPHVLRIPPRRSDALSGSEFIRKIANMNLADREAAIYAEFAKGNIPHSLRQPVTISETMKDAQGNDCSVEIEVLPDFLAVGSDDDFVRMPMLPTTAQRIATLFGASLPTRKLSDIIHSHSEVKMTPRTMTPDASMTTVPVFEEHNTLIEEARVAMGMPLTALIAGHKKDIVITNRLTEVPERLFIYGWHYTDGKPIQPLSGAHDVNYVDYSHGVRIVNKDLMVNGMLSKVKDVLQDAGKYVLLSDESGLMTKVEYTVGNPIAPAAPKSFAVVPKSDTEVEIVIAPVAGVTYKVSYGLSVDNLDTTVDIDGSNPMITGLTPGTMYLFTVKASNANGVSPASETLGAVTSSEPVECLVVNGFDRVFAGNKYAFVYEHGLALHENGKVFASATNEAVANGLVDLCDYSFVDYILGEESTADKTFDAAEQVKVKTYLENGGHLYVSSAEIGWDLGRPASGAASNAFMKDYLKCSFVADNPGASAGLYHEAQIISGCGFGSDNMSFSFADGTTTAVKYPDVINPEDGATGFLQFKRDGELYDTANGFAGIGYKGQFGPSDVTGRVIVMTIPFETIYPSDTRKELMKRILEYDFSDDSVEGIEAGTTTFLSQNFPNPAKSETSIVYGFENPCQYRLELYNGSGAMVMLLGEGYADAGRHKTVVDVAGLPAGMYFYRLIADGAVLIKKMIVK